MIDDETAARGLALEHGDEAALARLDRFVELLHEENDRQNLVSKTSLAQVWRRHIADSAQLLCHVPRETPPWLDLGTGAGFPGLIIAAMRPEWDIRLIESRKKRVEWLERVNGELGLTNCRVIGARLEDVESVPAGVISARAFAPMVKLLALSQRFSTAETVWLLPKGRSAAHELRQLAPNVRRLFHVEQSQTDPESGIIVGSGVGIRGTE
ncbi:MAG TPA: 16S rRNA (guanine(527)-N(7))-methyltransferase RsmG [Croceibacterium sp.]|nr:16S rRNA (guanine(527)-N(7))-methyltransferase RsmG [Croceibacterium sp.]